MSISLGLGTAIGGGLAALGGLSSAAVSAGATTKLNKKNRDWQEKMYSRKLADSREDYMRNVYYNSAQYKVKDMRAAGLNPNGSEAPVTGAVSQSSNPDVPSPVSQGYDTSGIAHGFASAGQILSSGITRSSELQIAQQNANTAAMDAATRQFSAYAEALQRKSEIGYIDSKTYGQELSNAYNEITFDNRVRQTEVTLNQIQQNTAESLQRTLNLEYDRLHLKPAQVAEINTHIAEINSAISDYQSLAKYRAQLISESAAKTDILKIEKQMKDIELQWLPRDKQMQDSIRFRETFGNSEIAGVLAGLSAGISREIIPQIENFVKRSFERAKTFYDSIPKNKGIHQGYMPTYPDFSKGKYGSPLQFK